MGPHKGGWCVTHAKNADPEHVKFKCRANRLFSPYICNILMHADRSQKNDFVLAYTCKNQILTVACLTGLGKVFTICHRERPGKL